MNKLPILTQGEGVLGESEVNFLCEEVMKAVAEFSRSSLRRFNRIMGVEGRYSVIRDTDFGYAIWHGAGDEECWQEWCRIISRYGWAFICPFEKVPLLIGDKDRNVQAIAKWRLAHGK